MGVRISLLAATVVVCLTACGGGGSASGAAGATAPIVTSASLDRSSLSLAWEQGSIGNEATVVLDTTSSVATPLFVGTSTPGGVSDPHIAQIDVAVPSASRATVRISPKTGLASGSYSGTVVINACTDAACSQHYTGSPLKLPYSFTVAPVEAGFDTLPRTLRFAGEAQQAFSQLVLVTLPAGATSYTATAADAATLIDGVTATGFRVTVPARAVGSYSTTVTVVAGSLKRLVTVQHTATPRQLKLNVASIDIGGTSGATRLVPLGLVQYAEGQTSASVSTDNNPWISVVPAQGGWMVTLASLPVGGYLGSVSLTSGIDRVTVPVRYSVGSGATAQTEFAVSPPALALASTVGGAVASQTLLVQRSSWASRAKLTLAYDTVGGWLSSSADAAGNLLVKADPAGLAAGVYRVLGTFTPDWPGATITVPVVFTVGDGMAVPAPQVVVVDSSSSASTLAGAIAVRDTRGQALAWTASSNTPWLRLAAGSGGAGTQPEYSIDTALVVALPAFTDVAGSITLTAQSGGGATLAPVQASVTLRRELAEVDNVGPLHAVVGQTSDVVVHGRGFLGVGTAFPNSGLLIGGLSPSTFRAGDNTLRVRPAGLQSLTAGDHLVRIQNRLGLTTSTALLRLRHPRALPAAALVTGGGVRTVLHDGVRQQLWVANTGLGAIQRWREVDGAWVADKLALANLFDIGISPDGAWLLATERSGKLHLIDPVAFNISQSYNAPGALYPIPSSGHGIAITNDNRAWLTVTGGQGTANRMVSFNLQTRSFAVEQPAGVATTFDGGPWYEASRNGQELLVAQSAVGNPSPPMLYRNMVDGLWRPTPAGLTFFYFSLNGLSDDAHRMVVMGNVFDAEFRFVGRPVLPDAGYTDSAAVLSPGGERLYVYALPAEWQNSAHAALPRVYIFNASPPSTDTGTLPLLGSVQLTEYPSCRLQSLSGDCGRPMLNITADGKTLLIGGDAKLLVVPLP